VEEGGGGGAGYAGGGGEEGGGARSWEGRQLRGASGEGGKGPRVLGVGGGLYMATGGWAASGPEVGCGGPNFLRREPNNLALGKETILIKLIIKNSKLMIFFQNLTYHRL
jgi:hypothetical protein